MTRIIGKRRTWRRRLSLLGALTSVSLLFALFVMPSAQAVHDLGVFELDGNATNDALITGDDWDNVCHKATAIKRTGTTTASSAVVTNLSTTSDLRVGMNVT